MRRVWEEPLGFMELRIFQKVLELVRATPTRPEANSLESRGGVHPDTAWYRNVLAAEACFG